MTTLWDKSGALGLSFDAQSYLLPFHVRQYDKIPYKTIARKMHMVNIFMCKTFFRVIVIIKSFKKYYLSRYPKLLRFYFSQF